MIKSQFSGVILDEQGKMIEVVFFIPHLSLHVFPILRFRLYVSFVSKLALVMKQQGTSYLISYLFSFLSRPMP